MPRIKKQDISSNLNINYLENNEKEINKLLDSIDDKKYFILNYLWFCDYYKIINTISEESVIRYNPNIPNSNFIEFTSISDSIIGIVKIPFMKTNIDSEFIYKFKHNISFSKYNNNILAIIFDKDSFYIKYNYSINITPVEIDNNNYFSLSRTKNDVEEDLDQSEDEDFSNLEKNENYFIDDASEEESEIDKINKELLKKKNKNIDVFNFDSIVEENLINENNNNVYMSIDDKTIKNVICYVALEFDNLKDFFKKLGNGRIDISIYKNLMVLNSLVPKYNKKIEIKLNILYVDESFYDTKINFSINSNGITKLKSLTNNFNIISTDNKKIFKKVELKIVSNNSKKEVLYGITVSPSNFSKNNKINDKVFNIYNSILLYIPQIK